MDAPLSCGMERQSRSGRIEVEPPDGWKTVNDACIGVPAGKGWSYTVCRVGTAPIYLWEAWKACEIIGMGTTMDEAIGLCRADYKANR